MSGAPLSVLIPTLNEAANLPECLASVAWADQVLVVDSLSNDTTQSIARAAGAEVWEHPFENYSRQKNWALDTLPFRNDWVLIVDADERVTPELRAECEALLASPAQMSSRVGYYLNRRFIFMGRWIRYAGWYPSWNLRLFQHRLGRYDNREVHEHVLVQGPVGYLQSDLLHEDRRGLAAYIARHNQYSTLEAKARFRARVDDPGRSRLPARWLGSPVERKRFLRERVWPSVPARPVALFIYLYLVRQGFRDGGIGLAFCAFHAFQEMMVALKQRELERPTH